MTCIISNGKKGVRIDIDMNEILIFFSLPVWSLRASQECNDIANADQVECLAVKIESTAKRTSVVTFLDTFGET